MINATATESAEHRIILFCQFYRQGQGKPSVTLSPLLVWEANGKERKGTGGMGERKRVLGWKRKGVLGDEDAILYRAMGGYLLHILESPDV